MAVSARCGRRGGGKGRKALERGGPLVLGGFSGSSGLSSIGADGREFLLGAQGAGAAGAREAVRWRLDAGLGRGAGLREQTDTLVSNRMRTDARACGGKSRRSSSGGEAATRASFNGLSQDL